MFVGKIGKLNVDLATNYISITESRTMHESDAYYELGNGLSRLTDVETWVNVLTSDRDVLDKVYLSLTCLPEDKPETEHKAAVMLAIHEALSKVYGKNYCVVPPVESFINDATTMGYSPVVLPQNWKLTGGPIVDFLLLHNNCISRPMTAAEQQLYDKARKVLRDIIPLSVEVSCRVLTEEGKALGKASIKTNEIWLNVINFTGTFEELVNTVLHEIGHVVTKCKDHERGFSEFFIKKLVDLALILDECM